ncbi:adenylyltransferase/cytidyltransferase family protein [Candidatus Saccharibacteria bacterium]|nr:adenylyltransferase/cytidyltransferase family protein [Candidatus Saccharibacteria bacterium]
MSAAAMPSSFKKRLISQSDLLELGEKLRENGKKIVFTAGSWDLMHVGQTRYLEEGSKLGDILVVGVVSDRAIAKAKGPNKPILGEKVRAEVVSALRCVDFVTIVPEPSCAPSLGLLKPDVYFTVKEDWAADWQNSKENRIVEKSGGKTVVVDRQSTNISTSKILARAIGGGLSDVLKDFMQYRKDPLKE